MYKFKQIVVLIWDFDGTLYKPNPELWKAVREAEYRTIMEHTGWDGEKTVAEFKKLHKIVYPSATEVTAILCGIPIAQAAIKMEQYFDRRDYLARDEKLIVMFKKLSRFRHFTLANGVRERHRETLKILGIPANTFEEMVTSDTVGVTKPHPNGFLYILKKTGLPPAQHLMIGDRPKVDLEPAKNLGIKTCLVWSKTLDPSSDVVVPTVYDVARILL